jgi:hypothetical protein
VVDDQPWVQVETKARNAEARKLAKAQQAARHEGKPVRQLQVEPLKQASKLAEEATVNATPRQHEAPVQAIDPERLEETSSKKVTPKVQKFEERAAVKLGRRPVAKAKTQKQHKVERQLEATPLSMPEVKPPQVSQMPMAQNIRTAGCREAIPSSWEDLEEISAGAPKDNLMEFGKEDDAKTPSLQGSTEGSKEDDATKPPSVQASTEDDVRGSWEELIPHTSDSDKAADATTDHKSTASNGDAVDSPLPWEHAESWYSPEHQNYYGNPQNVMLLACPVSSDGSVGPGVPVPPQPPMAESCSMQSQMAYPDNFASIDGATGPMQAVTADGQSWILWPSNVGSEAAVAVLLSHIPLAVCSSQSCVDAMLQQAGLREYILNVEILQAEDKVTGEVCLTLVSQYAAEMCCRHFRGCLWSKVKGKGKEPGAVLARIISTNEQVQPSSLEVEDAEKKQTKKKKKRGNESVLPQGDARPAAMPPCVPSSEDQWPALSTASSRKTGQGSAAMNKVDVLAEAETASGERGSEDDATGSPDEPSIMPNLRWEETDDGEGVAGIA